MPDFRIDVGFFTHIKTKRLRKRLGLEGVFALQLLWAYAAQCEHDEHRVYTKEDIEIAVDWSDETDISDVLAEIGYLDECEGGFKIHEWEIHNGFAASASKRSEHARNAANKRWQMREQCPSTAGALPDDANGNAPSPLPSPSPTPDESKNPPLPPKGDGEDDAPKKKRKRSTPKGELPITYSPEFERAWKAYPNKSAKGAAWAAWEKAQKRNMPTDLMEGIIRARSAMHDWTKDDRQFVPHMATWLNRDGWEDETKRQEFSGHVPLTAAQIQAMCAVN